MAKLDDDIDALFQLSLNEFIAARKTLAARLKKEGRANDAERVKLLGKPSISAWTVNQLYWQHRDAFDRLVSTGQRFRKAQTSGKVADMREALEARREALSQLSDLATTVLEDGGHNPSLDTLRRITATLEAMSVYASTADGPTPGRLTEDVDPPGFDSFAGFVPGSKVTAPSTKHQVQSSEKSARLEETRRAKKVEASRQARIGIAKVSLQNAKKLLTEARARAQRLESDRKKVDAAAKDAEKQKREAEERFKKARIAAEDATNRSQKIAGELKEATKSFEDAQRSVDKATKELETLFREKL